ncbi:PREDICTED: WD repeat-containing protein 37-like [Amphimedon queenslandica]|uniref:WD repeat-containing protein 37 n=1 Tax=Amphimedon queenslandica TaxID=400682 RepID=A0A1X7UHY9_AMPQE|nr:PREDICTED: WD repeat-containing protein 37-like [Amphimedon queenslandica]|eukprot:XP_003387860.1 PREDICTED: WD repeat-containing protein 37-like [Amphimedon queenslandica]
MSLKKKVSSSKKSSQANVVASTSSASDKTSPLGPDGSKSRLLELFSLIEKEFESLHSENAALREKVDTLTERLDTLVIERTAAMAEAPSMPSSISASILQAPDTQQHSSTTPLRKIKSSGSTITKKKLMPGSKKTTSNLKQSLDCSYVSSFNGHKDGVWHVSFTRNGGQAILGSASADTTASLWDVNAGTMLLKYTGHTGSVNCITFHPMDQIACTASGDGTAHVWKTTVTALGKQHMKHDSSGEDRGGYSDDEMLDIDSNSVATLKTPLLTLAGHTGPVMACDWMSEGDQLVTASWDHSACLWDTHTGTTVHTLRGHDQELTHVCTHPTQNLVVTSSRDTTFRLWDFRAPPIHSVNVFQGHSKAVTSAAFSLSDDVVSASDDHTVKIWDLHNMRYPVASIRLDCGINRISVSHDHQALAVPMDNSHIRLYDLGGNRIATLPHRNRKEHVRMVHCVCWSRDSQVASSSPGRCNLFSSGFDSRIIGWKVHAQS